MNQERNHRLASSDRQFRAATSCLTAASTTASTVPCRRYCCRKSLTALRLAFSSGSHAIESVAPCGDGSLAGDSASRQPYRPAQPMRHSYARVILKLAEERGLARRNVRPIQAVPQQGKPLSTSTTSQLSFLPSWHSSSSATQIFDSPAGCR
jgi:hypothetical protein